MAYTAWGGTLNRSTANSTPVTNLTGWGVYTTGATTTSAPYTLNYGWDARTYASIQNQIFEDAELQRQLESVQAQIHAQESPKAEVKKKDMAKLQYPELDAFLASLAEKAPPKADDA